MLPIVLTKKQKVLIIGAGRACEIKLKVLKRLECDITIVSEKFNYDFEDIKFTKIEQTFYSLEEEFFQKYDLIYIAIVLDDISLIEKLSTYKLINVLSNPDLSNFIHPCSRDDDDILVSVCNIYEKNPKKACSWAENFISYKNNEK
jgi:siroheme synthase (precorrin-2 oxidase/ferrochelatase)